MQAETEQRPHKVSFYVKKDKAQQVTEALSKVLAERGVSHNSFILIAFFSNAGTMLFSNDFVCVMHV